MQALIALIGFLIASTGLLFAVRPDIFRKTLIFFIKGQRLYAFGAVRIAAGILFLILANKCVHPWLIIVLGIILIVSSIVIFAMELNKLKKQLSRLLGQKDYTIRFLGTIAMFIGLLVVYGAIIQYT